MEINRLNNACIKLMCEYILLLHHVKLYNVGNATYLILVLYKKHPPNIHAMPHNYVLKLLCTFHLTALLEYMTALLKYIDLFVLNVLNVFQHDYCNSNQDLQNILEL